jgi:hypothetical protein
MATILSSQSPTISSLCVECRGLPMLAVGRVGVEPTGAMSVITFNPHSTAIQTHRFPFNTKTTFKSIFTGRTSSQVFVGTALLQRRCAACYGSRFLREPLGTGLSPIKQSVAKYFHFGARKNIRKIMYRIVENNLNTFFRKVQQKLSKIGTNYSSRKVEGS